MTHESARPVSILGIDRRSSILCIVFCPLAHSCQCTDPRSYRSSCRGMLVCIAYRRCCPLARSSNCYPLTRSCKGVHCVSARLSARPQQQFLAPLPRLRGLGRHLTIYCGGGGLAACVRRASSAFFSASSFSIFSIMLLEGGPPTAPGSAGARGEARDVMWSTLGDVMQGRDMDVTWTGHAAPQRCDTRDTPATALRGHTHKPSVSQQGRCAGRLGRVYCARASGAPRRLRTGVNAGRRYVRRRVLVIRAHT